MQHSVYPSQTHVTCAHGYGRHLLPPHGYGENLLPPPPPQDIPVDERTALSRGEFVRLQQLSRRRLAGSLADQTAARVPLYRLRAKAAQHIDVSAVRHWGPNSFKPPPHP